MACNLIFDSSNHCDYCGSLHQDAFMERLEAGTISISGTDKNYKVYVENKGGEEFVFMYRPMSCTYKGEPDGTFDSSKATWVTQKRSHTKFYWYHLSEEQQVKFIEHNANKVQYTNGDRLYVLPFFVKRN
jgi:hypothetical protein